MFIAHGDKVRKHSRWILGAILVLLIPGFIALFTTTGRRDRASGEVPMLRGKPLPRVEFEEAKRAVQDQFVIANGRRLPGGAQYEEPITREAVIRVLLLRKAKELGVRVAEDALMAYLRQQFSGQNGQFDDQRYLQFMALLNNSGVSEQRFQDLMRDQMLIGQLQSMIGDAAKVTPQEVELSYAPLHEKLWIDVVQFDVADTKDKPAVSDEDAAKYYEQNKQKFEKPAEVKVRYARFAFDDVKKSVTIPDTEVTEFYQQNLPRYMSWDTNLNAIVTNSFDQVKDTIRADLTALAVQRQAGEKAQQFVLKLLPADPNAPTNAPAPNFAKLAAEAGATVGDTDFFSVESTPTGLATSPSFRRAAFALSLNPVPPYSDPVQGEDGFYVLEYLDQKPARIPELAEVKTEVITQIQRQRVYDSTVEKARQAREQLRKLTADGKTFAAAAAELKLKPQPIGPFTITGGELDLPGTAQVQQAVLGMTTNAVSEFIQTANGGLFFQLKDRQPFDRAEFEKNKEAFARQLLGRARQGLFENWLANVWQEEQVMLPRSQRRAPAIPDAAGQPE